MCEHRDQCPKYECPLAHTPEELADNEIKHRCPVLTSGLPVLVYVLQLECLATALCIQVLHST